MSNRQIKLRRRTVLGAAAFVGASCFGVAEVRPDAGSFDEGTTDAGTSDAGKPETGDAGTPRDGGPADPSWRRGLLPLTFKAIGNAMSTVNPANDSTLNPNGAGQPAPWFAVSGPDNTVTGAWNGMTLHEPTGRLRIAPAGGHNDYAGNEVYLLELYADVPAWRLELPPTGAIGNTGVLDDGKESSNFYFDGRPRSTHTYDLVVARGDEMWLVQPGAPYKSGGNGTVGAGAGVAGLVRLRNGQWENLAQGAGAPGGANPPYSAFYDERRDRIYTVRTGAGPLEYWDVASRSKGTTGANTNMSYLTRSIRIPELDITAILSPTFPGHLGVFDNERHSGPLGSIPKPGVTGTPPSYAGYNGGEFYPNGDWVPGWAGGVGAIFCWHGGTTFWVLTPPAIGDPAVTPWAWSTVGAAMANTVDPGLPNTNGVYSRLRYSRALQGLVLVTSYRTAPVFFALA